MPCSDGGSGYFERVEALTRMLCGICTRVETNTDPLKADFIINYDPVLKRWWANHKEVDAKRRASELAEIEKQELIRKAKAKLTRDEQKLLGLKD